MFIPSIIKADCFHLCGMTRQRDDASLENYTYTIEYLCNACVDSDLSGASSAGSTRSIWSRGRTNTSRPTTGKSRDSIDLDAVSFFSESSDVTNSEVSLLEKQKSFLPPVSQCPTSHLSIDLWEKFFLAERKTKNRVDADISICSNRSSVTKESFSSNDPFSSINSAKLTDYSTFSSVASRKYSNCCEKDRFEFRLNYDPVHAGSYAGRDECTFPAVISHHASTCTKATSGTPAITSLIPASTFSQWNSAPSPRHTERHHLDLLYIKNIVQLDLYLRCRI